MSSSSRRPWLSEIDWLDRLTIGTVLLTVGFAAAAYGGVEPWSELVLVGLASLLAVLCCAQLGRGRGSWWLGAPISVLGGFGLLIALQATPLSKELFQMVSPTRALTLAESAKPTTSYYQLATTHGLRIYLLGVAVFSAAGLSLNGRPQLKLLLAGFLWIGVGEAVLSLVQIATNADGIYWAADRRGHTRSGSFLNHSNFSQFLNLTVGAGLGYLLVCFSESRSRKRQKGEADTTAGQLFNDHWFVFLGLSLQAIAIAASLSRAGLLGMVVGMLMVALLLGRQKSLGWRSWSLFALPTLVFGGVTLVGFDTIYERMATLEERESYADRWELNASSLRAAMDHFWFGAGLDNYQYVFPQYDTTGSYAAAEQADNDYLQLFVEMGVVGIAFVAAFLGVVALAIGKRLAAGQGHSRYALYGVVYVLAAIAVQCFSDFGQRLPAVFGITAAMCGLCFASKSGEGDSSSRLRWASATCLLLLLLPLSIWSIRESWADYRSAQWSDIAYGLEQRIASADETDPQDYLDRVVAAEQAAELRPNNLHHAFWLNTYRWQFVVAASGVDESSFAQTAEGREITLGLADEFAKVRSLCPVYGPAQTVEGELRLFAGDGRGVNLIVRGADLNPNNWTAVLAAFRLQATSGETDPEDLKRKLFDWVAVNGSRYRDSATILVHLMGRPDWARELAGEDPQRQERLLELLRQAKIGGELTHELQLSVARIKQERVLEGAASPAEYAAAAAENADAGRHGLAAELYLKALGKNYGNLGWRLALADTLIAAERYGDAERHARIAVRLHPGSDAARKKLEEVSVKTPATVDADPAL